MNLSDFDYGYPKELIAQHPLPKREASRMMVCNRARKSCEHSMVERLPEYLREGDLLIINDSKVAPARLFGTRRKEPTEVLVVEQCPGTPGTWRCLVKKAKRVRPGEKIFFGMHSTATVVGRDDTYLLVEFKGKALELAMKHHGVPPLPPYIERKTFEDYSEEDWARYQTVYAANPGSAAAPTAGLHLSEGIIENLKKKNVLVAPVTLHVGIDTFTPVRCTELSEHKMHGERIVMPVETAELIAKAKEEKRRVIAVGTTSARVLESSYCVSDDNDAYPKWSGGAIAHGKQTTRLFITPGYEFKVVDVMLTNFHQPKSTLIMMVSAFAGREFILSSYQSAIDEKYRLFSYGDCMLIE